MARPGRCVYRGWSTRRRTQEAGFAAAPRRSPTFSRRRGRRSLGSRAGAQERALQEARQVAVWRTIMPKKRKIVWVGNTPVTLITPKERRKLQKLRKKRLDVRRRKYPEVRGKVVDYISHSIEIGRAH